MDPTDAPALAGVHHLKLPVSDLARSRPWYRSRLGCEVTIEFVEQGKLMGYGLERPNGGRQLGLRLDPGQARVAAGLTRIDDPRENSQRRGRQWRSAGQERRNWMGT